MIHDKPFPFHANTNAMLHHSVIFSLIHANIMYKTLYIALKLLTIVKISCTYEVIRIVLHYIVFLFIIFW